MSSYMSVAIDGTAILTGEYRITGFPTGHSQEAA
jgi:hypothetical protein